jgi:hypothetical protein
VQRIEPWLLGRRLRDVGRKAIIRPFMQPKPKKTDVGEYPSVFRHVGLLVNEPSSEAGMPFI